jgi:hypothetical protein
MVFVKKVLGNVGLFIKAESGHQFLNIIGFTKQNTKSSL